MAALPKDAAQALCFFVVMSIWRLGALVPVLPDRLDIGVEVRPGHRATVAHEPFQAPRAFQLRLVRLSAMVASAIAYRVGLFAQ